MLKKKNVVASQLCIVLIQQTITFWYFYLESEENTLVPEQNTGPFSLGHSSDTSIAANKFLNQQFEVWHNNVLWL